MEKIFAIGDIHGCLSLLQDLMTRLPVDPEKDRIVFMGDYIDRGPAPKGVVDFILALRQTHRVVCLIGNHERLLLDFYDHGINRDTWLANGGIQTIDAYGLIETPKGRRIDIPQEHLIFFRSLLPYYETEEYIFVHAGLKPGVPIAEQTLNDMIWIRDDFIASDYNFGKRVIFGHTPQHGEPYIDPYKIGIDTAAVYRGKLTCLELPAIKFYQVP